MVDGALRFHRPGSSLCISQAPDAGVPAHILDHAQQGGRNQHRAFHSRRVFRQSRFQED